MKNHCLWAHLNRKTKVLRTHSIPPQRGVPIIYGTRRQAREVNRTGGLYTLYRVVSVSVVFSSYSPLQKIVKAVATKLAHDIRKGGQITEALHKTYLQRKTLRDTADELYTSAVRQGSANAHGPFDGLPKRFKEHWLQRARELRKVIAPPKKTFEQRAQDLYYSNCALPAQARRRNQWGNMPASSRQKWRNRARYEATS